MTNVFQHAVSMASFTYSMALLVLYLIMMACTLTACNIVGSVLSDKMVHVVKRIVSSCANSVFKYFALQPSYEYLNDTQDNMRCYKNKKIKSVCLYYRRVPKKLLNLYNKITLCRMDNLIGEIMTPKLCRSTQNRNIAAAIIGKTRRPCPCPTICAHMRSHCRFIAGSFLKWKTGCI